MIPEVNSISTRHPFSENTLTRQICWLYTGLIIFQSARRRWAVAGGMCLYKHDMEWKLEGRESWQREWPSEFQSPDCILARLRNQYRPCLGPAHRAWEGAGAEKQPVKPSAAHLLIPDKLCVLWLLRGEKEAEFNLRISCSHQAWNPGVLPSLPVEGGDEHNPSCPPIPPGRHRVKCKTTLETAGTIKEKQGYYYHHCLLPKWFWEPLLYKKDTILYFFVPPLNTPSLYLWPHCNHIIMSNTEWQLCRVASFHKSLSLVAEFT